MSDMSDPAAPPELFATAGDRLHELVTARTGLTDFGPDDYALGLRVLLHSMDYDPHFSASGRQYAWSELATALSARAIAVAAIKARGGVDDIAIRAPVVITGIPRTGTTALHKLMAADPQFQGLQTWITNAPMPRPPRETWEANPHFQRTEAILEAIFAANPRMRAAHNIVAEEVDECMEIMRQGFVTNRFACNWSAASYDAWWQTQSELPGYRYLKSVLQLVGSEEPEKRWLLKNPGHIANLDLLFAVFPDACVIQTHRNPAKAVPSLCQLLIQAHEAIEVGRVSERAQLMGLREVEKWAKAVRDAEPVRRAHSDQIIDIVHGDFHRDPMAVIARIYDRFGLTLSAEAEAKMLRRVADKPEMAHGAHTYQASDFGMGEDEILERFGDYPDRFGLVSRRRAEALA